jgi:hypothetical protein
VGTGDAVVRGTGNIGERIDASLVVAFSSICCLLCSVSSDSGTQGDLATLTPLPGSAIGPAIAMVAKRKSIKVKRRMMICSMLEN